MVAWPERRMQNGSLKGKRENQCNNNNRKSKTEQNTLQDESVNKNYKTHEGLKYYKYSLQKSVLETWIHLRWI